MRTRAVPVGAKARHLLEEHFRLVRVEGGRGLVEEQNVAAPRERRRDLDELQMAESQRADEPVGIGVSEADAVRGRRAPLPEGASGR